MKFRPSYTIVHIHSRFFLKPHIRCYFCHQVFVGHQVLVVSIMRRADLRERELFVMLSLDPDTPRVTAHTINGVPCILAGLNRHQGDFTMPSSFPVRDVLNKAWIREASKEEKDQDGKWYRLLEFQPGAVIHSNGAVAGPYDTLGLVGNRITILAQRPFETFEEVSCADVGDVSTPPTPPPHHLP